MHRPVFVVLLGLSLAGGVGAQPALTAASGLKPGLWEIVAVVEDSNGTTTRNITSRICYSPEDVASPTSVLPPQRGLGAKCLASDVRAGGDVGISWKLTCKGKDSALQGRGTMKPGPTAYSAEVHLERKAGGKVTKLEEKANGRWVGDCQ